MSSRRRSSGALVRRYGADLQERLPVVLQVLYLILNEGHATSGGDSLHR